MKIFGFNDFSNVLVNYVCFKKVLQSPYVDILLMWIDRNEYFIFVCFGVVSVAVALVVEGRKLFLVPRKWWCCGLSLPKWLLPAGRAIEAEQEGRFLFDVEIVLPLIGLIVAYRGTLRPVS